jgi:protein-tyrosine phosphatase
MASRSVKILFVCMGNICRSPVAETVMEKMIEGRGLEQRITVDSAGTLDYHAGELATPQMREVAKRHGYAITHRSRQLQPSDFTKFDYIVAMDDTNLEDMRSFVPKDGATAKISLLMSHCKEPPVREVPDPYMGPVSAFERVVELAELGCRSLLDEIVREHNLK